LAAGVAHEINNPLTVIIANAQLLLRELSPANRDLREMTEIIIKAGKRASESVQDLLDFSRHEQVDLRPTDVNETIRRTLSLVQRELQAGSIDLIFEPDEDLPPVKGSRDQFQSVWLNLIINAKQAIEPGTGEIRISTRRVGDSVQAIVADTGHGIEPDQLGHIFEPFYTTKELGRGTGLGLSICHRIVAQHGGDIHVRSQPGIGTQFTVELPIGMTEA
jgi:two-component system, NtrC family, sensor kinase